MRAVVSAIVFGLLCMFYFLNVECELPNCGCNEEYVCRNANCVNTCPKQRSYSNCDNCTYACYCKADFWRNTETGNCVTMDQCPCEDGRIFGYSNPCVDDCDSKICPLYAIAGCYCPSGQCTNASGDCVKDPNV